MEKTQEKTFYTTYNEAVNWLGNSYVLCNNITEVDQSIWDNARFSTYDEESDSYKEIFQYYITDASASDVEYLEKHFGLLFTYSDMLDCFILCVDHFGTSWKYVHCEVLTYGNNDNYYPHIKSYKELTGQEF